MAGSKYEKYIIKDAVVEGKFAPRILLEGEKDAGGANYTMVYNCIAEPFLMVENAHTHDYDQFLAFIGSNPMDFGDLGGEAEVYLGEEGEKHIINSTSIVHIPKGFTHCPLRFTRVDRPFVFIDIFLAPKYVRKPISG
jgi:hypothetical protein